MASGDQNDHVALGYAHDAFVASEQRPTSPAEREALMGALIAAALLCGLPPRTVTPIAWIERRLATYRAAFGLTHLHPHTAETALTLEAA